MKISKDLNLKSFLCCWGTVVLATSCTSSFEEYNTNPDEVTAEMADWDNARTGSFFLQMQRNVIPIEEASVYQVVEVMTGDGFVGFFGSPNPNINSAGRLSLIHIFGKKTRTAFNHPSAIYCIKPSLHGGMCGGDEWITEAEKRHIGWWVTSALESNIGLNAIAQWCATFNNPLPQGLGTGLLCLLYTSCSVLSYLYQCFTR